jgi:fatty-acyl-CoA synthase
MICGCEFPDHARAATDAAPALGFTVSIGASAFGQDYDALVAEYRGRATPPAEVEHDDPCWFFFTSGTTGRPKAAVLTHGHNPPRIGFAIDASGIRQGSQLFLALPHKLP